MKLLQKPAGLSGSGISYRTKRRLGVSARPLSHSGARSGFWSWLLG